MNNIQYRYLDFPKGPPPLGTEHVVSVADVSPLENGDVEVTLQYEGEL